METIEREETAKKHRFTIEEFRIMGEAGIFGEEERVELIDGEVFEMSPPGWRHAWYVKRLNRMLTRFVEDRARRGENYEVSIQDPLVTDEHGQPQPDAMLMKPVPPGRLPNLEDALIVVEVSDTTLAYDKNIKLPRYAAAGIPEVWICNLGAGAIEVHSDPTSDGFRKTIRFGRNERVESATIPDLAFGANEVMPPEEAEPESSGSG